MRIAIWHNLPSGGGKRALYHQVRGLLERGHHVEAWCPPTANRSYLPLGELITEHHLPLETRERPLLLSGSTDPRVGRVRAVWRFIEAQHRHCVEVAQAINEGGFDLAFVNSCGLTAISPLGRYLRIPSMLYVQEPQRWLYEVSPPRQGLPWVDVKLWGRYWWTPTRLRHALAELVRVHCLRVLAREEVDNARAFDRVLVNSYFSRESLVRNFGVDARVCYLGVDHNLFRPLDLPKEDYLVGLGAIEWQKNIELAIRTIAQLPEPRPPLVWIGNTESAVYLEELRGMARDQGVAFETRVQVSDVELVEILNRATAMLYAPRLEPFGLAPLEANACGTPVVAAAEGGVRESVIDGLNGLLRDAEPRLLAEAIQLLRHDPARARCLGVQGREHVQRQWTWASSIDRLECRFRELLSGN